MDISLTSYIFIGTLAIWLLFTTFISLFVNKNSSWAKFGIRLARKNCPKCKKPLPIIRKPKNTNQALFGGWTCTNCGTQIDKYGNRLN